ncbi:MULTISPECIES: response regulator transcription factor [Candidatus Ichthyocystis]|uniref:response regulator transcription factor n=1 Tax=Candidatus Ichthyocystis TaxID=2929841 RepID=UPI000B8172BE|nr:MULTISPECIES: response regulator transcription factor [Ichthyocystis]
MRSDVTIFVVDDDEAVRDSFSWTLEGAGYNVSCYTSADAFLEKYDTSKPGCLLLDVRMPGMSGLELQEVLLSRMKPEDFPLPVIFVTGHGDIQMAVKTMKRGAIDFIEKPFKDKDLFGLIDRAIERAMSNWEERGTRARSARLLDQLTPREREVLDCVVAGKLNKQIADQLGISIKTVEAHRSHVMSKLGARSVAEAVQIVLGQNIKKSGITHNNDNPTSNG